MASECNERGHPVYCAFWIAARFALAMTTNFTVLAMTLAFNLRHFMVRYFDNQGITRQMVNNRTRRRTKQYTDTMAPMATNNN